MALGSGDSIKPGHWTPDRIVDWILDSIMDSIFRLEFQLPGVKGNSRLQNLLLKSTHCNYTDWNIKYLSIYISIAAMKWLLVQQEVTQ